MAEIYDIDFQQQVTNLLPVRKRTNTMVGLLTALCAPLQWLRDRFFDYYRGGGPDNIWTAGAYVAGDIVVDPGDNGIWECFRGNSTQPSLANDPELWQKIADDFRGVTERVNYTSQTMTLEWILNRFFRLDFVQPDAVADPQSVRPDIYIGTNIPLNDAFIVANIEAAASNIRNSENDAFIKNVYTFTGPAFTIYVPESGGSPVPGWYTSLGAYAEQKIRSIADKYVISGIEYEITTY